MSKILLDFSEPLVKNAIEANVFELTLLFRYWDKAEIHDDPDMLWSLTKIPYSRFNNVLRAQILPERIDSAIEMVINRCKVNKVPLLWWTGPATQPADLGSHLTAHGFIQKEDKPGMAIDIAQMDEDSPAPTGLLIEKVTEIKTLQKWCEIMGAGFGLPGFAIDAFLDFYSNLGFNSQLPLQNIIGWLNGKPVATASLVLGAGVAGIYNVATDSGARRKGIGYAMTHHLLIEARKMGYRVGVLYASEMGINVYLRMGFKEYCRLGHYEWKNDPADQG